MAENNKGTTESLEKTLFKAADKLRKNMDAAEYKHIVLGLIFLKYSHEKWYIKRGQIKTMLDPFPLCRILACILRFSKDVRYPSHAYFSRN